MQPIPAPEELGRIGTVRILRQEWVKARPQDFVPGQMWKQVKPQYVAVISTHGWLLLAQVERHRDAAGKKTYRRTLVEIQELNEAS